MQETIKKLKDDELKNHIGTTEYKEIIKKFGGKGIIVNLHKQEQLIERNQQIIYDFMHGMSHLEISNKYNLTLSYIYKLTCKLRNKNIIKDYLLGMSHAELLKKYDIRPKNLSKLINGYTKEESSKRGVSNVQ